MSSKYLCKILLFSLTAGGFNLQWKQAQFCKPLLGAFT
jgi:hypothetical protein